MRGLVDLKNASLCVQQDSSCSSEAVELIQSLTLVVDAALTSDGYQSEYNPTFYNPSLFWTQHSPVMNTKVSTISVFTVPLSCGRYSTHQWWIPKWVQSHFLQSFSLLNTALTSDQYQSEYNPTLYSPSLLWMQHSPVMDTRVSTIPLCTVSLSCGRHSAHHWWIPEWVQSQALQSLFLVVDTALTSDGYQSEYNPTFYSPSFLW